MDINSTSFNPFQNSNISSTSSQISSGKQINSAADAPAAIQIIEQFNSQITGNNAAFTNVINGVSALQVAQGGLSSITDSLHQLRELGIQAGNGALNPTDREAIQNQADELLSGIQDAIGNSTFNNQSLLNQENGIELQVGANQGQTRSIETTDLNTAFNDISLFEISFTSGDISETLNSIDDALDITEQVTSQFASAEIGLQINSNNLLQSNVNQATSLSSIEDTDFAAASTELAKERLSEDIEITLLAQANANRGQVLQLLNV